MFHLNSHHLYDALQLDHEGNKIEHADCIAKLLAFSRDFNKYETRLREMESDVTSLPNTVGSRIAELRNYLLFSYFRVMSLAQNIMPEPSLYFNEKYQQSVVKDILCARNLIETISMFCASYDMFKGCIGNRDDFNKWKRRFVYSTNLTKGNNRSVTLDGFSGLTSPERIMLTVNALAEKHPFIRLYYHLFSEFCHPNGMGLYFVGNVDPRVDYGYNIGYALSLVLSLLDEYGETMNSFLDAAPVVAAI